MSASIWLANIGAFALQLGIVIGVGVALSRVLRLQRPRAALAYWRVLLLACLVLPLCQPWTAAEPSVAASPVSTIEPVREPGWSIPTTAVESPAVR